MTIVLDTNVLPRSADLYTGEIQVLISAARETGHTIVIPSFVLEEAVSARRREIEVAIDEALAALKKVRRFAPIALPSELPVPGELAEAYGEELSKVFVLAPLPEGAGDEALRRETQRARPTREGRGARDAAIWLTAVDVHEKSGGGTTIFLSGNSKDFGYEGTLHEDLRREVDDMPGEFIYCLDVPQALGVIAVAEPTFLDVAYLQKPEIRERIARAVVEAADRDEIGISPDYEVSVDLSWLPNLTSVRDSMAYSVEGRRVGVAWSQWALTIASVPVEAFAQILVREREGAPDTETEVLAIRRIRLAG